MKNDKKIFSFREVILIVIVCSFVMCFLGATLIYKHLGGVNFALLGEDKDLKEFISAYNNLVENYYDNINTKDIIDGAIKGMYGVAGDPYTTYLDTNSSSSLDDSLKGSYEGIGISINSQDTSNGLKIVEVYEDSPAKEKGLQPGDLIIKIDNEETYGKSADTLTDLIKKGDNIDLTISRNGEVINVSLKATKLLMPVVTSRTIEENGKKVGYLTLSVFNDTADIQISNHLAKLENENIEGLIIDLRDNSGGYLQIAQNIAEVFLEKGKTIYSLESKSSKETIADKTNEHRTYPINILINKRSASAAEILAAALKYSYGANLIGETTYGKGKVQERASLSNGSGVKYTTAKWLTPAGNCIDGVGLTPNVEVSLNADTYNKDDIYTDTQFMAALSNLVS